MTVSALILDSTLTCPDCGHRETEHMAEDSCQYLYQCSSCGSILKPKQGDCCVFCSYGTVVCPPKQLEKSTGGKPACCR